MYSDFQAPPEQLLRQCLNQAVAEQQQTAKAAVTSTEMVQQPSGSDARPAKTAEKDIVENPGETFSPVPHLTDSQSSCDFNVCLACYAHVAILKPLFCAACPCSYGF